MRPFAQSEAAMSVVAPLIVGVAMVVIWEIGCRVWHVPIFLFPKPSDIAAPRSRAMVASSTNAARHQSHSSANGSGSRRLTPRRLWRKWAGVSASIAAAMTR